MPSYKQLRRSRTDRMLAGVCGGLAHYFAVDPVAVRVGMVVLGFITGGLAVVGYIAAWIVMPEESPSPTPPAA